MAKGFTKKNEIVEELGKRLAKDLLPGDKRRMPAGHTVWQYRASWALTELRRAGEAANLGTGVWRITDSGRERLEKEKGTWRLKDFQVGQATVVVEGEKEKTRPLAHLSWKSLATLLTPEIYSALEARLRPDLGSTPPSPRQYVARNNSQSRSTNVPLITSRHSMTGDDPFRSARRSFGLTERALPNGRRTAGP